MPQSVYKVIEVIGTSTKSWEEAAKMAVELTGEHLRDLRVAEVVEQDLVITDGKVEAYRTKREQSLQGVLQQRADAMRMTVVTRPCMNGGAMPNIQQTGRSQTRPVQ